MAKIIKLSDKLSNLIAAGEVVVNMASVVKELVENSIDAKSKNITVDLEESGLLLIRVTDDGMGMSKEDIYLSVERHATSKIKTANDLFHITSLGFRGEALPSIASVSHFEIESSEGGTGHKVYFLNGEIRESGFSVPRKGTKIGIRYLFYNTPARLKHLKSSTIELSYITEYINKMALSHPEISFTLNNDERQLFKSNGSNDVLKVLSNIYSIEIIKNMVPFSNKDQYFAIDGYLTKPFINRSLRSHITVIVNGRVIKNNKIINSVNEAFKTYLPIGKYPIVLLNITLDPLLIDVNVHPQKLEVKFTEERMLLRLIKETISEKLRTLNLIPEMKNPVIDNTFYPELNLKTSNPELLGKVIKEEATPYQEQESLEVVIDPVKEETTKLPRLEYIGQYLGTYLIAQSSSSLYLIDQHAAAERVRYENYYKKMANPKINTYELLIPITLDLSNAEVIALKDSLSDLELFGIKLISNSTSTVDVTTVPSWFIEGYERSYTEEMIKYILEGKDVTIGDIKNQLAKDLSCKHSIKANHFINKNEIKKLLFDLENCQNPYTCPHGRPTIIKFTQTEVEKMFKRIM
ncbi:MAG: DNA mismatch repair endonuclease MutL [Candidatus Izemoplasma sp.]